MRPCRCFSLFPTIPSQLADLDEEGGEDEGEGPGAPLEVAEEEEVDCELDVRVDVEPVEEDVEGCVHADCFQLSKLVRIHFGSLLFVTFNVFEYFLRSNTLILEFVKY